MHAHVTPGLRDQLLEVLMHVRPINIFGHVYSVHLIYGYMLLAMESVHGGKGILFYFG